MKLKQINAAVGLLSCLCMLAHMGYTVGAYIAYYYNPFLLKLFSVPFIALVCIHSILGMLTVFLQNDGGRLDLYPKQNIRTILQRVSAALIFPLLILHINTFSLMRSSSESGNKAVIVLLILVEILFFAAIETHVAVSFTNGFITLGMLTSRELQKKIDRVIYILGALSYLIAVYAVVKTQAGMFLIN